MTLPKLRIKFLFFTALFVFTSCDKSKDISIAFYYWRSNINLNNNEIRTLAENHVSELYLRYFDVTLNEQSIPVPESPLTGELPENKKFEVVPVIFLKNNVFEKSDSTQLNDLPKNILSLVKKIDRQLNVRPKEIQFDCDWTLKTKDRFFRFLKDFKQMYPVKMSATIRLHQYKYPKMTGIPPVDEGVLMYYNMNEINADTLNSVYDRNTGLRYLKHTSPYPLPLIPALPIFSWGVRIRDGRPIQLLSQLSLGELEKSNLFRKLQTNRYQVVKSGFFRSIYLKQGDILKMESVSEQQLMEMTSDLKKYVRKPFRKVIFFDLNTLNTARYDSDIFKKVAHRTN